MYSVCFYCKEGWPEKKIKRSNKEMARNDLSLHDNLLLCGNRIVIPMELRQKILHKLHNGQQHYVQKNLFSGQAYLKT